MPVSDKNFGEMLYELLPSIYKQEDLKAEANPQPLKRFLQVASVGMDYMEKEIDTMQLLFQTDSMPEKFLDPVGRMLGLNFTADTNEMDKRKLLSVLPTLYKLKGNDIVFELLARIVFNPEAITAVEWSYTEETTTLKVKLTVSEYVPNLEAKQKKYLELVEYFRPVNVGTSWIIEVYYSEEFLAEIGEEYDIERIHINDNLFGQYEYTGNVNDQPRLLNTMRLNQTAQLYGILWEKYGGALEIDISDIITIDEFEEFTKLRGTTEYAFTTNRSTLNSSEFKLSTFGEIFELDIIDTLSEFYEEISEAKTEYEELNVIKIDDNVYGTVYENDSTFKKLNSELYLGYGLIEKYSGDFIEDDTLNFVEENFDESLITPELVESDIYVESESEISGKVTTYDMQSSIVDCKNTLNLGLLGSTMILSKERPRINYNY